MDERPKDLIGVLVKGRRVRLELSGRPYLDGLPILVGDTAVQIYRKTRLRQAFFTELSLAQIEAVWDLNSGSCIWRAR